MLGFMAKIVYVKKNLRIILMNFSIKNTTFCLNHISIALLLGHFKLGTDRIFFFFFLSKKSSTLFSDAFKIWVYKIWKIVWKKLSCRFFLSAPPPRDFKIKAGLIRVRTAYLPQLVRFMWKRRINTFDERGFQKIVK